MKRVSAGGQGFLDLQQIEKAREEKLRELRLKNAESKMPANDEEQNTDDKADAQPKEQP